MGKTKNSGLGIGTWSSPQGSLKQTNVDYKVNELSKKYMIERLRKAEVKYDPDNVLFAINDSTGQLIWLEKGNEIAGLTHIKIRHSLEYADKGIMKDTDIVAHLQNIITTGKLEYSTIITKNGKQGYERLYSKNGEYYLLTAVGTNGFLITAYLVSKKKAEKLIRRSKNEKRSSGN